MTNSDPSSHYTLPVSMRDIARRLRIHRSTVSRALAGHPHVSAEVVSRVKKAAQQLGYRSDPLAARILSSRRRGEVTRYHGVIAYLSWIARPADAHSHRWWNELAQGIAKRAHQLGWKLDEIPLEPTKSDNRRITQIMLARGIRGLLIAPAHRPHARIELGWENFTAVSIGYSVDAPTHRICNDFYDTIQLALAKLAARGCRRIGLAIPRRVNIRTNHRFVAAFRELPLSVGICKLPPYQPARLDEEAFIDWCLQHRPDAVLGTETARWGPWLAKASSTYASKPALAVSLDWRLGYDFGCGVSQDHGELAALAVDFLLGLMRREAEEKLTRQVTLTIKGRWLEGDCNRVQMC